MKWFFSGLILLLVVIGLLVSRAPASLIPQALQEVEARGLLQAGSPKLVLSDTSGTLWQGRAEQALLILNGGQLQLGTLDWTLDFWTLLQAEPELHIYTQAPGQQLKATVSVSATATDQGLITVEDVEGRAPISVLEPWLPMLVKGDMAFVLDHVVFTPQQLMAIDGVLNLEYVDWLGGDFPMPLGSYLAQITLRDDKVQVQINDFSASLGLDGQLAVTPTTGHYTFNARLQPQPDLAPQVVESIKWLGKLQANGDVLINQRGRF